MLLVNPFPETSGAQGLTKLGSGDWVTAFRFHQDPLEVLGLGLVLLPWEIVCEGQSEGVWRHAGQHGALPTSLSL